MRTIILLSLTFVFGILGVLTGAEAHHILGRPAYNLNEDSNTPPSMQAELVIGKFQLTYMIYPAFPKPGDAGRVSLYIVGAEDETPFDGKVAFTIREMPFFSWLGIEGHSDRLGVQPPDDRVYRQGFITPEAGDYLITATFEADSEPYVLDFPLRVGAPPLIGPFALGAISLLVGLILIAVLRRRKTMTAKIRAQAGAEQPGQTGQ
ncbi:MAG: hypothetical protein HN478_12385 [Rhodospirillaceae bacterium]|jgi:hypothetical protein|nr:hypothetical protein [Rhodospirillaceae bacterium]MBT4491563.1 hypothetical protein [Rhodospirillaceae bacterium]MBT5194702.1 hypothetical protein [Rhodospirillaceae bacterium]MBT5895691.1 hypothetical protein [Rhodospirillaceae bacterium]MBT6430653.1 hypothetical protein [Rhodospirillaceae bacterium]